MATVVTILEDHKGMTSPRVSGDEYFVDVLIDMDAYPGTDGVGILVNAADCGLSTIHQVMVTGQDTFTGLVVPEVLSTGSYTTNTGSGASASTTSFCLNVLHEVSNQIAEHTGTTDYGSVRCRVYGLL
tara:strand:+ start:230 stop:613 length:384 start_codon:yes stop_codon:yes gene_type:complete